MYLALLLFPAPKVLHYYLEDGSGSKEKIDSPTKKQTKKSGKASPKKTKAGTISKGQNNQTTHKNQAEDPSATRAPTKTKNTKKPFSPAPATSAVLDKIIPSRNDIAKNVVHSVPKKSKKHSFLKLFLTDFVQSVIREELEKKTNN